MNQSQPIFPSWMRGILLVSAVYNIAWGLFVYNFTESFVKWITNSVTVSTYQIELHGLGLFMLGFIFIISAIQPIRFWYFIAFGFLAKAFGGIWVYFSVMRQTFTSQFILHLFINDYIWAVLLGIIAWKAFKIYRHVD